MTRKIAILSLCVMLAACETMATGPDGAAGAAGPSSQDVVQVSECTTNSASIIVIKYGGSKIDVTHRINVKKNKFFKLRLNPENTSADPVNYKTMNVYLFGSTSDAQWLNGTYNAEGDNQKDFDICASAPAGEYKYMVVIPGIGTIDPRIQIEN